MVVYMFIRNLLTGPNCPDADLLNEVGDMVIDGSSPIDAAREVARHINRAECKSESLRVFRSMSVFWLRVKLL